MILPDTNILIDFWRNPEKMQNVNINPNDFAISGPIKTELLQGAKDDDDFDAILHFFEGFRLLVTDEYDYEYTGLLLQTLRKQGIQLPMADALIAYTAIKYDVPLWTKDKHFKYIQAIYPELKLFEVE